MIADARLGVHPVAHIGAVQFGGDLADHLQGTNIDLIGDRRPIA